MTYKTYAPERTRPALKLPFCLALFLLTATAFAAPPTLAPMDALPNSVLPGHTYPVSVVYKQAEGDAPTTLKLVVDTPGGILTYPAPAPVGDPTTGLKAAWQFVPDRAGQYQYHFEAVSSTGAAARFPAAGAADLEFESVSLVSKYVVLGVGLLVALFFLPFVVYVASRSVNRRGDPAAAARVALLVGVLASYGLYLYLFADIYKLIGSVIGGVVALAILVVLFSRRRTA